mgnify:CR=1 FL=1
MCKCQSQLQTPCLSFPTKNAVHAIQVEYASRYPSPLSRLQHLVPLLLPLQPLHSLAVHRLGQFLKSGFLFLLDTLVFDSLDLDL